MATKKGNSRSGGKKKTAARGKKNNTTKRSPMRDEVIFIIILVVALLLMVFLFGIGGIVGDAVSHVLFGLFGAVAYVFPILLVFIGGFVILNSENEIMRFKAWYGLGFFLTICGIVQWFFNDDIHDVWETFSISAENHSRGGFFGGILSFELSKLLGRAGDLILLLGLLLLFFVLFSRKLLFRSMKNKVHDKRERHRERRIEQSVDETELEKRQMKIHTFDSSARQEAEAHAMGEPKKKKGFTGRMDDEKNRETGDNTSDNASGGKEATTGRSRRRKKDVPPTAEMESVNPETEETRLERELQEVHIRGLQVERPDSDIYEKELEAKFGKGSDDGSLTVDAVDIDGVGEAAVAGVHAAGVDAAVGETIKTVAGIGEVADCVDAVGVPESEGRSFKAGELSSLSDGIENADNSVGASDGSAEKVNSAEKKPDNATEDKPEKPVVKEIPYVFPPLDLLSRPKSSGRKTSEKDLKDTAIKLQETLESFGVGVTLGDICVGPSVTRYELIPNPGVQVNKITARADDIKLSLAAADIRIEAPIPGKSAVGIEVPNETRVMITLRELLESDEFQNAKSRLTFAVGKDISGQTIVTDIAKMPHVLVAGSTGSGKSVLINTLIMSIIFKANPNDVKLIMVDPKMVEFMAFADIPHLMIPVVDDPKKASAALAWAVAEMEKRYKTFAEIGIRDIAAYNNKIEKMKHKDDPQYQKMPQIVIIVDEFADLMMVASHDVEDSVMRLAQKARAAGIHLVLATQRPSVNVITGVIKANIPSRIALSVSSQVDSRTIIDTVGAEKLLGNGDMLFAPQSLPKPIRVQGAFVSDDDRDKVVSFLREHGGSAYDEEVTASIETVQAENDKDQPPELAAPVISNERDPYFADAGRLIIEKNKASIGALQRVLRISFNRGARIMDQLADAGVVGPEAGTKPREILMTIEQFEQLLAEEGNE
ncbi:MAG: DNA translocase FtsK 4TM domain-containing protein [Eubacterium sp.]|nr:DNA translocase FtsK 4TM domain-containing protein [Eubacterium sp.]